MIDTHCHLSSLDIEVVSENDLEIVITIGPDLEEARKAIELAEKLPNVYAVIGLHPMDAEDDSVDLRQEIEFLAKHPKVVGIGETGLDDYWDKSSRQKQISAFEWQIDLAKRLNKALIVHTRDKKDQDKAHKKCIEILQNANYGKIILHCFSGNKDYLVFGLEKGLYISFAGNLTFKNAPLIKEAALQVPLDRILVETDAPYLAPVPFRGQTNRPALIRYTLECLANIRNLSFTEIEQITSENAKKIYNIKTI